MSWLDLLRDKMSILLVDVIFCLKLSRVSLLFRCPEMTEIFI